MLFKTQDMEAFARRENGKNIFNAVQEAAPTDFTLLLFEQAPNPIVQSLMYMTWSLAGKPMMQMIDRVDWGAEEKVAKEEEELMEYTLATCFMLGSRNVVGNLRAIAYFTAVVLKARERMLTSIEGQEVAS